VESRDLTFPTLELGGKNLVFTPTSYTHFRLPYQGEKNLLVGKVARAGGGKRYNF